MRFINWLFFSLGMVISYGIVLANQINTLDIIIWGICGMFVVFVVSHIINNVEEE